MKNKKKRLELRVERRKNAGEILKPFYEKVDAYALVEVRTGLVLRWAFEREGLDRLAQEGRVG